MQDRIRRKGTTGTLLRLALLPLRYGVTPTRLQARLRLMINSLNRLDVKPTINVTARNLESVPEIANCLREADLGIHGYRHLAYETLSAEGQAEDLDRALSVFRQSDLDANGFRGPYLRTNSDTLPILAARHLQFDSSAPCMSWLTTDGLATRAEELVISRYGRPDRGPLFPFQTAGLVEIPVSMPDDEILVDGLGITNKSTIQRVLGSMLSQTMATGSLIVLQIHPERYDQCSEAVEGVIDTAADAGGWLACLSEITSWTKSRNEAVTSWPKGHPFAVAVTGDLDAMRLSDFGSRFRQAIS